MRSRDIIFWWEARRIPYNLALGVVGFASLLLVIFAGGAAVSKGEDFEEPLALLFGPPLYAIGANVCYTFGWILDLAAERRSPRKGRFYAGLAFAIALTALPGLWAVIAWLATVVTGEKL